MHANAAVNPKYVAKTRNLADAFFSYNVNRN